MSCNFFNILQFSFVFVLYVNIFTSFINSTKIIFINCLYMFNKFALKNKYNIDKTKNFYETSTFTMFISSFFSKSINSFLLKTFYSLNYLIWKFSFFLFVKNLNMQNMIVSFYHVYIHNYKNFVFFIIMLNVFFQLTFSKLFRFFYRSFVILKTTIFFSQIL